MLAVSGQSITSLAHWVTKNSESNDETIDPKNRLVEETKIKNEISEITNSKNELARKSQGNHNSDSYTDIGLEKNTDTQTKAKAQLENTNNLLLLAKKINQSINKNIAENIQ